MGISKPDRHGVESTGALWLVVLCWLLALTPLLAQRQMENLGRGVVASRTGSNAVYVSWRLLGHEPADIGFNIYRSRDGGSPVKLNANPITLTTD